MNWYLRKVPWISRTSFAVIIWWKIHIVNSKLVKISSVCLPRIIWIQINWPFWIMTNSGCDYNIRDEKQVTLTACSNKDVWKNTTGREGADNKKKGSFISWSINLAIYYHLEIKWWFFIWRHMQAHFGAADCKSPLGFEPQKSTLLCSCRISGGISIKLYVLF